jgi:hypothetical protein
MREDSKPSDDLVLVLVWRKDEERLSVSEVGVLIESPAGQGCSRCSGLGNSSCGGLSIVSGFAWTITQGRYNYVGQQNRNMS